MQSKQIDLTPKGRRTRSALLAAAATVVGRDGLSGLSVMSVCQEAGVGRTSFYNYFDDIDALSEAVALAATQRIKDGFDRLHADQPRGLERLEACLSMILHLAVEDRETTLLITALAESTPDIGRLLETEIMAELAAVPQIPPGERESLTQLLSLAVMALARQLAKGLIAPALLGRHVVHLMKACQGD